MSVTVSIKVNDCSWKWSFFHSWKLFFPSKNWGWWWQAPQAEPPEPKCWSRIFFTDATDTPHESIFCQLFDFLAISGTIQHVIRNVWYILKMKYFFHCLLEETLGGGGRIFWKSFLEVICIYKLYQISKGFVCHLYRSKGTLCVYKHWVS